VCVCGGGGRQQRWDSVAASSAVNISTQARTTHLSGWFSIASLRYAFLTSGRVACVNASECGGGDDQPILLVHDVNGATYTVTTI
jgi:hypothetical protein